MSGYFPMAPPGKRTMCFVDGENLVFRYQDMVQAGLKPNASSITHIPNIFVWHPFLRGEERDVVRVNYYTSAVGDDDKLDQIRDQIGKVITTPSGYGRRVCAHVFKKPKATNKSKLVDITLAIDALRHVHDDQLDTLYLFSGDADFVPLIKEIMRHGKQLVVGALSSGLNPEMRRVGDQFINLDDWFFIK